MDGQWRQGNPVDRVKKYVYRARILKDFQMNGWAENLISRLPNKSADIFNVNFKCGSFYLIVSLF